MTELGAFDLASAKRIRDAVRKVERLALRNQHRRIYRNPMGGGGGGGGLVVALLTHVQQCASVAGIPEYHWVEAEISACAAAVKSGGRSGGPESYRVGTLSHVGSDLGDGALNADAPQLVFPVAGSALHGDVTAGSPDTIAIEFEWTPEDGGSTTSYWLGVGEPPPPGSNVTLYHDDEDELGLVTTHEVAGIPADGRTIRVRVWNDSHYNDYDLTIVPGAGAAIGTEDLDAIARGDDAPVPAEYDNTGDTWIPADKTELDTPILVLLRAAGDVYLFVRGGGAGDVVAGPATDDTTIVTAVSNVDVDTCTVDATDDTIDWIELVVNGVRIGWIKAP